MQSALEMLETLEVTVEERRKNTPARKTTRASTIGERVAVLESKVDCTEQDLRELKWLVTENFKELKASVEYIKVRKNPVMEFVEEHWKVLLIGAAVLLGKDVSALVQWMKAFGG